MTNLTKTLANYNNHKSVLTHCKAWAYCLMRSKYVKTGSENFRRILQGENGVVTLDDIAQIIALKLYENAENIVVLNGYNEKHEKISADSSKDNTAYKNRLYNSALCLKKERDTTLRVKRLYPKNSQQYKYHLARQNDLKNRINKTLNQIDNINAVIDLTQEYASIEPITLLITDSVSKEINSAVSTALRTPNHRQGKKTTPFAYEDINDHKNDLLINSDFSTIITTSFIDTLTDTEKSVLKMLYADYDYRTIAESIGFSKSFVGKTVTKIRQKYTAWTAENA